MRFNHPLIKVAALSREMGFKSDSALINKLRQKHFNRITDLDNEKMFEIFIEMFEYLFEDSILNVALKANKVDLMVIDATDYIISTMREKSFDFNTNPNMSFAFSYDNKELGYSGTGHWTEAGEASGLRIEFYHEYEYTELKRDESGVKEYHKKPTTVKFEYAKVEKAIENEIGIN